MPRNHFWAVFTLGFALAAISVGVMHGTPPAVYAANPPSPANSTVQAQATLLPTGAGSSTTISVRLLDANNAPVAGDSVALTATLTSGGRANASVPPSWSPSDASGLVTFSAADEVAETVRFTAADTTAGVTLLQTAVVSFAAPSPYGVVITPAATNVDSGGQFTASVNTSAPSPGVGGVTVSVAYDSAVLQPLSCTSGQGTAVCNAAEDPVIVTAVSSSGYTGTADLADIVFKAIGQGGAQTWLTPTISSLTDPRGAPLPASFATPSQVSLMTPASATNSTVVVSGSTSVTADGSSSAGILVTLQDTASPPNLLSGKNVSLTASGGHSQITAGPEPSGAQGIVSFNVTDKTAETVVYTATDTTDTPNVTFSQQVTITFVPGPASPAHSSIATGQGSVLADGASSTTVTVTASDANGNPLAGAIVDLDETVLGGGTPSSTISPGPWAFANSSGIAVFTVTDYAVEAVTFTASVDATQLTGLSGQVNFVAGAPSATRSPVVLSSQYVSTDNPNTGTITVTLYDAYNHQISGDQITLMQTTGAQSVISPAAGTTDSGGAVTFTLTDTRPETVTYTITAANPVVPSAPIVLGVAPQIVFTVGAPSVSQSTATTSATTLAADGAASATITVTARDAHANPLSGIPVLLIQELPGIGYGHSMISPSPVEPAASSGVATFTVTDTVAEDISYVPSLLATQLPSEVTVDFLAGAMKGSSSSVTTETPLVAADGSKAQIVVRLGDTFGNPVAGDSVTLAQNSGAKSTIAASTGTSDKNGVVFFAATDAKAETVVFRATDATAGVPVSGSAQVTFMPGPAVAADSSITPTSQSIQANSTPGTITAVLEDAQHNPIGGKTVTLTAGSGHSVITPAAAATTDANGHVSFTVSDGTIETVTYTLTDSSDSLTLGTAAVGFVAAGPMTISGLTSTFTYTSRTITASVGGTACASASQSYTNTYSISLPGSCSAGVITFSVAGQAAGLQTTGGATCLSFTADTTVTNLQLIIGGTQNPTCPPPTSPVSPLSSTVSLGPSTVLADGTSAAAITVLLKNGSGSPVSGKTVTLGQSLQSGGASHSVLQTITGTTDSTGQASFSVTDTTVENVSYTADDVTDTTAIAAPVTASFVTAPSSGSMTINGTTSSFTYGNRAVLASVGGSACAAVIQNYTSSFSMTLPSFCGPGAVTFTVGGQVSGVKTNSQATCLAFASGSTGSGLQVIVGGTPQTGCAGPGPVSLATSTVVATPPNGISDGTTVVTIVATLEDATGVPVAGKTVKLAQALAQGGTPHSVLSATSLTTASNGEALFEVTDATAERVTFTAQDTTDNLTLTQTPTVNFLPPKPQAVSTATSRRGIPTTR
jgi:hypothetical protein